MTSVVYFGIDVSKAYLDLATQDRYLGQYANVSEAFASLLSVLGSSDSCQIGLESTGVYSQAIANYLSDTGYTVYMIQPGRVRWFAKSQGILAKTDAIDGQVIAQYIAHTRDLRPYQSPTVEAKSLRALIDRRDQLVSDRQREKCRREACRDAAMHIHINEFITTLTTLIRDLEGRIDDALAASESLKQKADCLQDVSGVGRQTAVCLLTHLPELGSVNRQKIAALAGLAPYPDDSGTKTGKRRIYGGRARVRRALYLAALSASRHNATLHKLYTHLLSKGKEKKVALMAIARRLLAYLNGLMKTFQNEPEPT